jgi:uncharacterized protein YuzE
MTARASLSLEIDQDAGAAYLQFSDCAVTRSVEFNDHIIVDLDVHGVVVGIELLDLKKSVPLDELVEKFHVRTEAFALLLQSLRSSTRATSSTSKSSRLGAATIGGKNNLTLVGPR